MGAARLLQRFGNDRFCDDAHRRDSAKLGAGSGQRRFPMSERDWEEEQRSVLARLFDSIFGRREASEEEIGNYIHWLGTVNKNLDDDD